MDIGAPLVISLLIIGIGLVIAAMRKGSANPDQKPSNLKSFNSRMLPRDTFNAILRWASTSTYQIDSVDEARMTLLLSDSATATSWGFFYPTFVSSGGDSGSLVEVGIRSKAIQIGPVVTRAHEKCVNAIRTAIAVQVSVEEVKPPPRPRSAPPSGADIFLYYASQDHGPFSVDVVWQMRSNATIPDNAYFWKEGMADWLPITQLLDDVT